MSKPRDLFTVAELIRRRYGGGDALIEAFLDHEAIFTLDTLMSYGPEETTPEAWQEYVDAAGTLDLEASAYGAYETFQDLCKRLGVDGSKVWDLFADACSYWGSDMHIAEIFERVENTAASYESDGRRALDALRGRT